MSVLESGKSNRAGIEIVGYADERFSFDFYSEASRRIKGGWKNSAKAVEEAHERVKIIASGRVDMVAHSMQIRRNERVLFPPEFVSEKSNDKLNHD